MIVTASGSSSGRDYRAELAGHVNDNLKPFCKDSSTDSLDLWTKLIGMIHNQTTDLDPDDVDDRCLLEDIGIMARTLTPSLGQEIDWLAREANLIKEVVLRMNRRGADQIEAVKYLATIPEWNWVRVIAETMQYNYLDTERPDRSTDLKFLKDLNDKARDNSWYFVSVVVPGNEPQEVSTTLLESLESSDTSSISKLVDLFYQPPVAIFNENNSEMPISLDIVFASKTLQDLIPNGERSKTVFQLSEKFVSRRALEWMNKYSQDLANAPFDKIDGTLAIELWKAANYLQMDAFIEAFHLATPLIFHEKLPKNYRTEIRRTGYLLHDYSAAISLLLSDNYTRSGLSFMTELDLSNSAVTHLETTIFDDKIRKLKKIILDCTPITELPENLDLHTKKLELLSLRGTLITSLHANFPRNIPFLDFRESLISELPNGLCPQELKLGNTLISKLPEVLNTSRLKHLDLSGTPMSTWPSSFNPQVIGYLDISGTNLTRLPENSNWKHLRHLDISNTQFTALPENLNRYLSFLNTRNTKITSLPNNINVWQLNCDDALWENLREDQKRHTIRTNNNMYVSGLN